MDSADSPSIAAAAAGSTGWNNDGEPGQHHAAGAGSHLHPLRASLSTSDAGSLSLHASQRLQSTPRGKAARGGGPLHRVYRATHRPVTVSSSATESSEAGTLGSSSVSLSSAEEDDVDDMQHNSSKNDNSALAARDYWSRIMLNVGESDSAAVPFIAQAKSSFSSRQQYLDTQTPSTGLNTSVLLNGSSSLTSPLQPRRSASLTPPGQTSSRFAAAVSHAALEQEQRDRSTGSSSAAERSTTPQQHSYHNDTYSNAYEGQSEAASRVHDIFQRHIHNASTGYTSRRSSTNTTLREPSQSRHQPRQRLRDLLSNSSERDVDYSQNEVSIRPTRRPSKQSMSRPITVDAQSSVTTRLEESPKGRSHPSIYSPSRPPLSLLEQSRQSTQESRILGSSTMDNSQVPEQEMRTAPSFAHTRRNSSGRLSREWRDISERAAITEPSPQRNAIDTFDSEPEDGSDNDGDVEDHQPDRSRAQSRESLAQQTLEDEDSLEESFPSLPELPSEEDEDNVNIAPTFTVYASSSFQRHLHANTPVKEPYDQGNSPAIKSTTPTRDVPPHSPSPRRIQRQPHTLFQNSTGPKTPPKTPRFPGHYLSSTPFTQGAVDRASSRPASQSLSAVSPDVSRSVVFGDTTLAMPSFPGGYTSPFPHPKMTSAMQQTKSSEVVQAPHRSAVVVTEEKRKTDRFSTMLHRVIEDADGERSIAASPKSRSTPSKTELSRLGGKARSIQTNISTSATAQAPDQFISDDVVPVYDQTEVSISHLGAAERTLQNLLVDIAKPLKGLLGGFAGPDLPAAQTETESALCEDSESTATSNGSWARRAADRIKRRDEQDAMLRKLQQADELDHSLVGKAEELKYTLEDMSNKFTTQVSSVLHETFAKENRRRKLWFLFMCLAELSLVWALWSFANARANLLYQTTYYDPFSPELYAQAPPPHIASLFPCNGLASTTRTSVQDASSSPFLGVLTSYFRTSSSSISSFWPTVPNIPDYDMSVISRQDTLQADTQLVSYVHHFIGIFKSFCQHLLSIGLGTSTFAHGTLGGIIDNSGSVPWSSGRNQLYRVPT